MILLLSLFACTGDPKESSHENMDDSSSTTDDSSTDDSSATDDSGSGTTASLVGQVTTSLENSTGDLYFGIFDADPTSSGSANTLGNGQYLAVNVNTAPVDYRIDGLPVGSTPVYVIAFLDTDANVTETNGPDGGDYLTLVSGASPSVTLGTAGDHTLNLELNTIRPEGQ